MGSDTKGKGTERKPFLQSITTDSSNKFYKKLNELDLYAMENGLPKIKKNVLLEYIFDNLVPDIKLEKVFKDIAKKTKA